MKNVQNQKQVVHLSILNKVCGTPGLLFKNETVLGRTGEMGTLA